MYLDMNFLKLNKYIQPDGCIVKAPNGAFTTITVYEIQTIYFCKLNTVLYSLSTITNI